MQKIIIFRTNNDYLIFWSLKTFNTEAQVWLIKKLWWSWHLWKHVPGSTSRFLFAFRLFSGSWPAYPKATVSYSLQGDQPNFINFRFKKKKPERSVYTATHLESYLTEPLFIDLCGGRWYEICTCVRNIIFQKFALMFFSPDIIECWFSLYKIQVELSVG